MTMTNRSEVMKKAWVYRKQGMSFSAAQKKAWDDALWAMDFGIGEPEKRKPVKKQPVTINPIFNGDIAVMLARYRKDAGISHLSW
jgi:hypothetical protein